MVIRMETATKPPKKVKVALFLDAKVAHELKVQAATAGAKGLSEYVTRLILTWRKRA